MEHITALLLIVGCSSDLSQCQELRAPVSVFETAAECTAERPFAQGDFAGRYPRIFGKCLAVDPALEDDYATVAWTVHPDGRLDASVEIGNLVMASNSVRSGKEYLSQQ